MSRSLHRCLSRMATPLHMRVGTGMSMFLGSRRDRKTRLFVANSFLLSDVHCDIGSVCFEHGCDRHVAELHGSMCARARPNLIPPSMCDLGFA